MLIAVSAASYGQTRKERKAQQRKEQNERIKKLIAQEEEGTIIFNKQNAIGLKLMTDGYGLYYEHGWAKSIKKTNLIWIELAERKHPKEEKITYTHPAYGTGNPFIFGKINNLYYAKLGFSQSLLLGGKGNKNGVAVTAIYGGGFSAGFLKPYYLKVPNRVNPSQIDDVRYKGADTVYFIGQGPVLGSSGFTKGFGMAKFVPGAHARAAVRFDYGRYRDVVSALEAGVNADYYFQEMPMMAQNPAKKFFFNAYVALIFGKRK